MQIPTSWRMAGHVHACSVITRGTSPLFWSWKAAPLTVLARLRAPAGSAQACPPLWRNEAEAESRSWLRTGPRHAPARVSGPRCACRTRRIRGGFMRRRASIRASRPAGGLGCRGARPRCMPCPNGGRDSDRRQGPARDACPFSHSRRVTLRRAASAAGSARPVPPTPGRRVRGCPRRGGCCLARGGASAPASF